MIYMDETVHFDLHILLRFACLLCTLWKQSSSSLRTSARKCQTVWPVWLLCRPPAPTASAMEIVWPSPPETSHLPRHLFSHVFLRDQKRLIDTVALLNFPSPPERSYSLRRWIQHYLIFLGIILTIYFSNKIWVISHKNYTVTCTFQRTFRWIFILLTRIVSQSMTRKTKWLCY